jgi:hypothetical protein
MHNTAFTISAHATSPVIDTALPLLSPISVEPLLTRDMNPGALDMNDNPLTHLAQVFNTTLCFTVELLHEYGTSHLYSLPPQAYISPVSDRARQCHPLTATFRQTSHAYSTRFSASLGRHTSAWYFPWQYRQQDDDGDHCTGANNHQVCRRLECTGWQAAPASVHQPYLHNAHPP